MLGQSQKKGNDLYSKNLELVKRENSVIMLEDNYEAKYQGFNPNDPQSSIIFSLMQNAHLNASLDFAEDVADAMSRGPVKNSRGVSQDPFWVLWRTAMPAVLIEVGFMSNPDDLAILRSPEGRDAIATNIFNAFWAFKTRYDRTEAPANQPVAQPEPQPAPVAQPVVEPKPVVESKPVVAPQPEAPQTLYGVQVLVSSKKLSPSDPFFKGFTPVVVPVGNVNKYIVGLDTSLENVRKQLPKVKAVFKDSFVVKVEDGVTKPIR